MASPHICIIGSLNIDFVTYTRRCPGPGETLTATSFTVLAGGKGANQAVACGRASFTSPSHRDVDVSMIGAVGADDPYYKKLLRPVLEHSGVRTSSIDERQDSKTGSATILVEEDGQNRIMVVPGANYSGMDDTRKVLRTITQCMLSNNVESPITARIFILQGEIPRDTTLQLLRHLNATTESEGYVIFNPAPVFPEGVSLKALDGTSVLVVNETEAEQLSSMLRADQSHSSVTNVAGLRLEKLASYFHNNAGIKIVLITLGAKGVFFSTATGRQGLVQGVKVGKVVDTTAAGDTFVGFFATAFARFVGTGASLAEFDREIEEVVQNANAAAAVCVQRQGAMQSIPFAYDDKITRRGN